MRGIVTGDRAFSENVVKMYNKSLEMDWKRLAPLSIRSALSFSPSIIMLRFIALLEYDHNPQLTTSIADRGLHSL